MSEKIVALEDVVRRFPVGSGFFTALDRVTLAMGKGEFTGLVGPSGSGKTTLLNIIGSLDSPSDGRAGRDIGSLSHREAADLRNRHIGFIFQTYNLLPVYSVYENVEYPLLLLKMKPRERREAVMAALDWVGLTDKVDSRPAQLSGGESQRVAIARAMVKRPALVLADEPTANLDAANSHHILERMVRLNEELDTTFVFATHDQKVIGYLRRVVHLEDGRVVRDEQAVPVSGAAEVAK
jgi:putative ABC transport system ATP-binding protein